jgi:hypothetical protein
MLRLDEDKEQCTGPEELARGAFSRCSNWPDTREGQLGLAQALRKAADEFGQTMGAIVERCAGLSQYCPTDFDLRRVAAEMRDQQERARRGVPAWKRRQICQRCSGSGWEEQDVRGEYTSVARCSAGCSVPSPEGKYDLSAEALR